MPILPEGSPETGTYDGEVLHLLSLLESIHDRLEQILLECGEPSVVFRNRQRQRESLQSAFEALGYPGKRGT